MIQPDFEQPKPGQEIVDIVPDVIPITPLDILQDNVLSSPILINPTIQGTSVELKTDGDFEIGNYLGGAGCFWNQKLGTFSIKGGLSASLLDIPDTTTADSFHVNTAGDAWWGSVLIADATAKILKTGVATFKNVILQTSVQISNIIAGSEISIQGWIHTLTFSVTDLDTVAWSAGSIKLMDGTTYEISAGNTGNMSAETYIYLDVGTSTTILQTTTTKTNAVGSGRILISVAQNGADEASFVDFGSKALNILGTSIVAGSITGNEIAANTITANKIDVSNLAAISADIGAITAGNITLDASGYIRGGQTDYNTGIGFFLGYSTDAYKFSIGNPAGNYLTWDGSILSLRGNIQGLRTYTARMIITANNAVLIGDGSSFNVVNEPTTATTDSTAFGDNSVNYFSQKITIPATAGGETLTQVTIRLQKLNSPTDDVLITIEELDGNGHPTGEVVITVGSKSAADLTTTFTNYTFNFGGIILSASTSYGLVFKRSGSLNDTNKYNVNGNAPGSGDRISTWNGSTWSNVDRRTYHQITQNFLQGSCYKAGAGTTRTSNTFCGFATKTMAYGESAEIQISGIFITSGLSGGSIYYLSDTFGAIVSSAGTVTKKMGLALSSTDLHINYTI